ncbi:MAG: Sua5/YciO/YrdC/YwlC family protein [Pseudomonadales bacterium]
MNAWQLRLAEEALRRGELVLHATEGVWGLACDPLDRGAVAALLAAKGRAAAKGLILIGAEPLDFAPELDALDAPSREAVLGSWPGPVTWVLANGRFPDWVTGGRGTVAVRVPGHPQARALAGAFGAPIVSTSANRSGMPSARSRLQAVRWLRNLRRGGSRIRVHLLPGETQGRRGPSEIRTPAGARLRSAG